MSGFASRSVWPLALWILTWGAVPLPARGDLVYFSGGGEAQLPAEIDGEVVRLIAPDGPVEFLKADFRAIVPGHAPEQEWPGHRDRAAGGDALDRYRAAWWALERGLTPEAVVMLRSAHEADRGLQPVARLATLLERLGLPASTPDLAPLVRVLPEGMSTAEGTHLVLLHQHDEREAAGRLELLDRVLTSYYLCFTAQGFDLRIPETKLVAVWFAREADYLAYLRKEAGDAFLTTRGYYHPTRRVVFFYDGRSRADYRRSLAASRRRIAELDRADRAISARSTGAEFRLELAGERPRALDREAAAEVVARLRRDSEREILLLELDRIRVDGGAAVHELVHQLVVASGLAPRYDRFPVWLHEGLAMQFEEFRGGRWAGIGPVQAHRLDQWRRLHSPPALESLLRDDGFGGGYAPDRYAAAWALVFYLRKRHPDGFVAFLDQIRNPRPGHGPGDGVVEAFRAAFGPDLAKFRDDWVAELGAVAPPLEANTPPGRTGFHRP